MVKKRCFASESVIMSEPLPKIDAHEIPEFYALYQRAIFMSLERRGLINMSQRDAALTAIDLMPRNRASQVSPDSHT